MYINSINKNTKQLAMQLRITNNALTKHMIVEVQNTSNPTMWEIASLISQKYYASVEAIPQLFDGGFVIDLMRLTKSGKLQVFDSELFNVEQVTGFTPEYGITHFDQREKRFKELLEIVKNSADSQGFADGIHKYILRHTK